MTTYPDHLTGPHGTAHRIPTTNYRHDSPATLDAWIITAPGAHPHYTQYLLDLISITRLDATEAAHYRPGATHELLLLTLNPERGPYHPSTATTASLHILYPVTLAQQITGSDEQARHLAEACAAAVVAGRLRPETSHTPDQAAA
jgi:hypothetical protein